MSIQASARGPLTVAAAYQYCTQLARRHYENFPTASLLIRRELRPVVAAVYAFARQADDLADEGSAPAEKRLKQLHAWEILLERCTREQVDHPVFLALGDAVSRYKLPVSCLHDLLTAFRMDVSIHAYESEEELLFYCRHSANPVGRLILALHGISDPRALQASDAVCTALQLTNFWQDLSVDLPRGRCYLPEKWLLEVGLNSAMLLKFEEEEALEERLKPVMLRAVSYTTDLFTKGGGLLAYLPLRLRLQVAATIRGGMRVLRAVAESPDPLRRRPVLGKGTWMSLAPAVLVDVCKARFRPRLEAA